MKKEENDEGFLHWAKVTSIGFVAGAIGQYSIYANDTVKTRLQNQTTKIYKGNWDCFKQIIKNEGFFSLYRGIVTVALMTSPEKALKLGVNDYARERLSVNTGGRVTFRNEILAGSLAGFAQCSITCPMEILKIRLQMEGQKNRKNLWRYIPYY